MIRSIALVATIMFLGGAQTLADGKNDFDVALQSVTRLMNAGKWKEAKSLLAGKLAEHVDQSYVRERLIEIQEDLKRCSFELAFPRLDVEGVLCGEVGSYDPKTGRIELRYKKPEKSKGGGKSSKEAEKPEEAFPCEDFERTDKENVLKLPFTGPYSIELDGKAMDQICPMVRVGIGQDATYTVTYDFGSSSTIQRSVGETSETVASSTTFSNVSRPYKIKISVRDTQIDAAHNGKRIVLAEKDKGTFGRFGFAQFANLREIRLSGQADRAWIEAQIDARAKADLAEFEKTYDAEADLPEWLRKK